MERGGAGSWERDMSCACAEIRRYQHFRVDALSNGLNLVFWRLGVIIDAVFVVFSAAFAVPTFLFTFFLLLNKLKDKVNTILILSITVIITPRKKKWKH
jgi:hypothetical protein